ncbi:unnamed protein product, partial [marine sediment metagenome]
MKAKKGCPDCVPKQPNFQSFDGENIPVLVSLRKFNSIAIPRLFRIGDATMEIKKELIAELARCLGGKKARPAGRGWLTCCPAHDDRNPSL